MKLLKVALVGVGAYLAYDYLSKRKGVIITDGETVNAGLDDIKEITKEEVGIVEEKEPEKIDSFRERYCDNQMKSMRFPSSEAADKFKEGCMAKSRKGKSGRGQFRKASSVNGWNESSLL